MWNRDPAKARPLADAGAAILESPAAVAAASDIVFTCLTDTSAVETVVFGPDGIASGASAGTVLVDFSSIQPARAAAMAQRLRT